MQTRTLERGHSKMSEGLTKEERKKQKRKEAKKKKKLEKREENQAEARRDQFEERISIGSPENEKNEDDDNFESELCWCIEQLELGIRNKNPSKDGAERTSKLIRLLKSEKSSKVKKRQVMRNTFGDYRKKIAAEVKQESSKIKSEPKISSVSETKVKGSVFIRKKEIEEQNGLQYQALDESEKGTKWRFQQSENSFQFSFPEPQEKAAK